MSRSTNNKIYRFRWMLVVILIAAFSGMVLIRSDLVNDAVGIYADCGNGCYNWIIPAYDALILAFILMLIGSSYILPRWAKWMPIGFGILMLIAYSIDLFVFLLLHHRLHLADFFQFVGDMQFNSEIVFDRIKSLTGFSIILLFAIGCASFIIIIKAPYNPKQALMIVALSSMLLAGIFIPNDFNHISAAFYKDVITNNLPNGMDATYSISFKEKLLSMPESPTTCTSPERGSRPVILLIVESLSLYQSKYLSGLYDFLPELDGIAKKYSHLEYFYANGFNTDGGLISLLTGHVPLPSINRYKSTGAYLGYKKPKQALFEQLANAKITAGYFGSGDLGFINTGDWLRQLNFDIVSGPEDEFYNGMPRGSFNDPGDRALYQRYLHWFDKERTSDTFFLLYRP